MDKRKSSGSGRQKIPPRHRISGTGEPRINEDNASMLIGSIVEKGVSDIPETKTLAPTPPPRATVLPFPVARHRSHGPHWGPVGTRWDEDHDSDDHNEDAEEYRRLAASERIAAFARPVQRKEKKELNLHNWREIAAGNDSSFSSKNIKRRSTGAEARNSSREVIKSENKRNLMDDTSLSGAVPMEVDAKPLSKFEPMYETDGAITDGKTSALMQSDTGKGTQVQGCSLDGDKKAEAAYILRDSGSKHISSGTGAVKVSSNESVRMLTEAKELSSSFLDQSREKENQSSSLPTASLFRSNVSHDGHSHSSLESQIDAENCARLQNNEEKMDPSLLKLLKRRGQEKFKKQNLSGSQIATDATLGSPLVADQSLQNAESQNTRDRVSNLASSETVKDSQSHQDHAGVQNVGPRDGSLWNAWTVRVEAVRKLRFSLDGNVIQSEIDTVARTGLNRQNADSVAERDFLRTEGDPGAAGYTIKEAVALTRSVVPGQRALALHLLATVLDKAMHIICRDQVDLVTRYSNVDEDSVDWEAVWAFALGPEPELVLTLRMCLDDNHNSVVLACARVIECILCSDLNENFFDKLERMSMHGKYLYTAPVFRSKPEIDGGLLHGGFWKYSAKSSNVLPMEEIPDDESEGKRTIQDDIVVAGQDFIAGFVRMGVLPRIRYILETDPAEALEERMISILIAIARHSPTASSAIMDCPRLIQIVVHRFSMKSSMETQPSKIKSVTLLRVLAQSNRNYCIELISSGSLHAMIWQLYQPAHSLDQWIKLGKERCKLSSSLMIEQLRLWRTCIEYGYCVSYFSDIFHSMCLWLNPPSMEKLLENNITREVASISDEAYLVLAALGRRLPMFHSQKHTGNQNTECTGNNTESWSWSHVTPMVDLGVKWIEWMNDSCISQFFESQSGMKNDLRSRSLTSLLWVYSSVMHMLSVVLERVGPDKTIINSNDGKSLPWLPEFVPKVGLEIIRQGLFSSLNDSIENGTDSERVGSFIKKLSHLRLQNESETSLASVCCLHGFVQLMVEIDCLIQLAKAGMPSPPRRGLSVSAEERILEDGMLNGSLVDLQKVLDILSNKIASEWQSIQSIEMFGRGGLAPGVGVGWGASHGGYWSRHVLLAQKDAGLLVYLLGTVPLASVDHVAFSEGQGIVLQRVNGALGTCLTAGPRDGVVVEKAFDFLFRVPVLMCLNTSIQHFFFLSRRSLMWEYSEEDLHHFSKLLSSHFRKRWLCVKKKARSIEDSKTTMHKANKSGSISLETVHEDMDMSDEKAEHVPCTNLTMEWAYQRLPLPMHWFISPMSSLGDGKQSTDQKASGAINPVQDHDDLSEVAKAGMFFLLGLEAMSCSGCLDITSPTQHLSLVWKFHSLSMILLVGLAVLEEQRSRDVYEALQELFGQFLDREILSRSARHSLKDKPEMESTIKRELLSFGSEIHDSYSTFIETLVEQFAAVSYGDLLYGRQVAMYLHRHVEVSVRLAAWNALSNSRVLDLLPPLDKCLANAEGYLEPPEDDEHILEAYVKSWVSGALERAAARGSLALTLVLHHISSFIFLDHGKDLVLLRNKLVKSLLRDCSRKQQHEGMMMDLIRYNKSSPSKMTAQEEGASQASTVHGRLEVLKAACEGNTSLLTEVEKLRSKFCQLER
ncbi:hypothetical protein NL676_038324 [Syzygium grande]|nr:hypothetical protein NL676_038324 [Syzygium grande]